MALSFQYGVWGGGGRLNASEPKISLKQIRTISKSLENLGER